MLANKTCIVTGSTAGIGKAIASAFLKEGAFVFINGRSERTVNEAIHDFEEQGLPRDHIHGIAADNVTVNSILPGSTLTEGISAMLDNLVEQSGGKSREEVTKEHFATREPTSLLQRFLTTNEIADAVVFLASDRASGINGSAMRVEGGDIRSI